MIKFKWPCLFHRYKFKDIKPTGKCALTLALVPTREYEKVYQCEKCGKIKRKDGFVIPCDQQLNPKAYNDRDWPIDKNGNEMTQ